MTKEELKNAVMEAARKTWEQQGAAVLAAMGAQSVSRDEVVQGLMNARELTANLTPEAATAYRALPPLIKRALLTMAFPDQLTSSLKPANVSMS
jgi:hypothetical protein